MSTTTGCCAAIGEKNNCDAHKLIGYPHTKLEPKMNDIESTNVAPSFQSEQYCWAYDCFRQLSKEDTRACAVESCLHPVCNACWRMGDHYCENHRYTSATDMRK